MEKQLIISGKTIEELLSDPEFAREKEYVTKKLATSYMIFNKCSNHALFSCLLALILMSIHHMVFSNVHSSLSLFMIILMAVTGLAALYDVVVMLVCRKNMKDCHIYFSKIIELAVLKQCLDEVNEEIRKRKEEVQDEKDCS